MNMKLHMTSLIYQKKPSIEMHNQELISVIIKLQLMSITRRKRGLI